MDSEGRLYLVDPGANVIYRFTVTAPELPSLTPTPDSIARSLTRSGGQTPPSVRSGVSPSMDLALP
ncbi:MAG TPA: hypothetical protein VGK86_05585, partial [Thermoanaerobaculia bacterium]